MARKVYKQNDNNLAIAYYRFSSHSQNEASIDQQRDAAHSYAKAHGYTIVREYEDRAISGTTDERPGFQMMLREVKDIQPAVLILWKVDRLGRDRITTALAKDTLRRSGCKPVYVAEAIPDEDAPEAILLEGMMESMAEFYSAQLKTNIVRGLNHNAKNALSNGRKILGYTKEKGKSKPYIIDPVTAPIVQRIFADYIDGKQLVDIAEELNEAGYRTTRGGDFNINGLRHILHNRAYIGEYRWNDTIIPDGMPVLIPEDTFYEAQERFSKNRRRKRVKPLPTTQQIDEDFFWLRGKLYCGECGSTMHGYSGTSKTGAIHYYYICHAHTKRKCKKKNIQKDALEKAVYRILSETMKDPAVVISIANRCEMYYNYRYKNTDYLESLQASMKDTEGKIGNIVKAIEGGAFTASMTDRLKELELQKQQISDMIKVEEANLRSNNITGRTIMRYLQSFIGKDMEDAKLRGKVLAALIDRIYIYENKIAISFWYSDDKREIPFDDINNVLRNPTAEKVLEVLTDKRPEMYTGEAAKKTMKFVEDIRREGMQGDGDDIMGPSIPAVAYMSSPERIECVDGVRLSNGQLHLTAMNRTFRCAGEDNELKFFVHRNVFVVVHEFEGRLRA